MGGFLLPGFFAFIIQSTDMLWILISQNNSVYCWIFPTGENVTLLCVRDFCFAPCCIFMSMHVSTNVPFLHATLVSGICMHIEALCTDVSLFASILIQKLGSWKVMANMACYLGVLHIFMYFRLYGLVGGVFMSVNEGTICCSVSSCLKPIYIDKNKLHWYNQSTSAKLIFFIK